MDTYLLLSEDERLQDTDITFNREATYLRLLEDERLQEITQIIFNSEEWFDDNDLILKAVRMHGMYLRVLSG